MVRGSLDAVVLVMCHMVLRSSVARSMVLSMSVRVFDDGLEELRKLAAGDVVVLTDDELYEQAAVAAAAKSAAAVAEAMALGELDRRAAVDRDHGLATARWHANETGTPRGQATSAIKTGRALARHFGDLQRAAAEG